MPSLRPTQHNLGLICRQKPLVRNSWEQMKCVTYGPESSLGKPLSHQHGLWGNFFFNLSLMFSPSWTDICSQLLRKSHPVCALESSSTAAHIFQKKNSVSRKFHILELSFAKLCFLNLLRKYAGYLLWVKESTLLRVLSNWNVFPVNLYATAGCEAQCIMVKLSAHWKPFWAIARSYGVLINLALQRKIKEILAPFQKEMFPLRNTYW